MSDSIRKVREEIEFLFGGKESHKTFECFVNKDLKLKIIAETYRYVVQKNECFDLSVTDLNTSNFILMFTGYHSLPMIRMFWKKEEDTSIPLIYEIMRRASFETIK